MGGQRIEIRLHHSIEELEEKMKKEKDAVEFKHWQILRLLAMGYSPDDAAHLVGVTYDWVRKLIHRYNEEGQEGMRDKRKELPGKEPFLNEKQQRKLYYLLQERPPDGGLWTGPKVTKWIEEETGRKVVKGLGWTYLKKLGFSLRKPRPKHIKTATREEKRAFKKNSGNSQNYSRKTSRKESRAMVTRRS